MINYCSNYLLVDDIALFLHAYLIISVTILIYAGLFLYLYSYFCFLKSRNNCSNLP